MLIVYTLTEGETYRRNAEVEALLARMACGSLSAMGELYELIKTDIYAYALSKTADREDAEDITHDTFVQIWRGATQYTAMGKPFAWIFTVEMNLIRKHFLQKQKTVPLEETVDLPCEDDIEERVGARDFLGQLLTTLGEEEREILSLHIVSGLKHREIARLMNKPLSTVLSRYNRAIKKLQIKMIEKEEG